MTTYLVQFVNSLNPNGNGLTNWPKYTTDSPQLLTMLDGFIPRVITLDTFRQEPVAFLESLELAKPL
jgi:acetylcholinesterase